jgi:hypothetical protein
MKKESVINRNLIISMFLFLLVSLFMASFVFAAVDENSTFINPPDELETSPIEGPTTTTPSEPETTPIDPEATPTEPKTSPTDPGNSNPIDSVDLDPKQATQSAKNAIDAAKNSTNKTNASLLEWIKDNPVVNFVNYEVLKPIKNGLNKGIDFLAEKFGFNVGEIVTGKAQLVFASFLGIWICLFYLGILILNGNQGVPHLNKILIKWGAFYLIFWILFFILASLNILEKNSFSKILFFISLIFYIIFVIYHAQTKWFNSPSVSTIQSIAFISTSKFSRVRFALTFLAPIIYLLLNLLPIINRILQVLTFTFFVSGFKRLWLVVPLYAALVVFGPVYWARYAKYRKDKFKYSKAYEHAAIYEASKLD